VACGLRARRGPTPPSAAALASVVANVLAYAPAGWRVYWISTARASPNPGTTL
jgi:hypothetical protein